MLRLPLFFQHLLLRFIDRERFHIGNFLSIVGLLNCEWFDRSTLAPTISILFLASVCRCVKNRPLHIRGILACHPGGRACSLFGDKRGIILPDKVEVKRSKEAPN